MTVIYQEPCDVCHKRFDVNTMTAASKVVCRATHSSPEERENVFLCPGCQDDAERDPDYERANLLFRESHGGEL